MKFVIQRVNHASVTVDGQTVGSIGKGLLILFGAGKGDTEEMLPKFVDKITKLRIFSDENDKINLSLLDVGGELLVVSQFTLYADCRKGNRPSFFDALEPDRADALYEKFLHCAAKKSPKQKPEASVHICVLTLKMTVRLPLSQTAVIFSKNPQMKGGKIKMFRLWCKLFDDSNHLLKDMVVENDDAATNRTRKIFDGIHSAAMPLI